MGKKIIKLTESDLEKIVKRVINEMEVSEGTLSSVEPKDGKIVVNGKNTYRLETDSWIPVPIDIKEFSLTTGDFNITAPIVGNKIGRLKSETISNLGSRLADGEKSVSFPVELDGEAKELRFVMV